MFEPRTQKWPGWGLPEISPRQAIEVAGMQGEEYDRYFSDKGDFTFRTMFGRMVKAAEPFRSSPSSSITSAQSALSLAEALVDPEVAEAIEKFQRAGRIMKELRPRMKNFYAEAEALGFPCPRAPGGGAPFDAVSDYLRGMQGAMTDMYRNPDKLHRLVDERLRGTLAMLDSVPPTNETRPSFDAPSPRV